MFKQSKVGQTNLFLDDLGFGCASVGNLYKMISDSNASAILDAAIESGFSYFDTAPHYGQGLSERRVGNALRGLQGQGFVLSSKVGRKLIPAGYRSERHGFHSSMPFDIEYDYSYDGVMRSFEDSMQRLGLDRIDILYMHDIGELTHGEANKKHFPIAMQGGYKALDELRSQGLISAIGLGVNEYQVCEQAMEYGQWDCFLLAGRYTLLEQKSLDSFLPKCLSHGASIVIGGPYNSGILATGIKHQKNVTYDYGPAPKEVIDKVRAIEELCELYNVPLAAAALQFPLAHPAVISVIPGIGSLARVTHTKTLMQTHIPNDFWLELKERGLVNAQAPLPNE